MSDPPAPSPDRGLPEGIPAPPPPRPDLRDHRSEGPTYGEKHPGSKKRKGRRERKHPTDPYEPLPKSRNTRGCLFAAAVVLLLALLAAGSLAWLGPGRFAAKGYRVVRLEPGRAVIRNAPGEPTVYLSRGDFLYLAPKSGAPVAIIARSVYAEGDFYEDVSITAAKVSLPEKARFAKDLEVYALEFRDLGITLKGVLKGRVGHMPE